MPNTLSVDNNFIGGLKTEFTGLNFPENACTATSNCVFSLIGDVLRREGINFEPNFVLNNINTANAAISYFKWTNAGGDGSTQVFVLQVGGNLYFFKSSGSTASFPLSSTKLMATIAISTYLAAGSTNDVTKLECQYATGNGYLFVFHPYCDPFYCTYSGTGGVISNLINIQTRDFSGVLPEPGNPAVTFRPTVLTNEHNYNLQNQGWTNSTVWTTNSTTSNLVESGVTIGLTNGVPAQYTFTVASGLTVAPGTQVSMSWSGFIIYTASGDGTYATNATGTATGNVVSYSGTTMVINVQGQTIFNLGTGASSINSGITPTWSISASNLISTISTWKTQIGNYPSNSDIWFEFKDAGTLGGENGIPTFNPAVTIAQVSLGFGQSPQGHFVLNEFNQDRSGASGILSITPLNTTVRPKTGAWFQGRVWYSGVDATALASGDMSPYTWSERIYFSQIVTDVTAFGNCFQVNDPTDETLNTLLPTDGGVIVIQGSGSIYKLFPIQNGVLVFAANGVWLITGNSGLGFTADDYTITKISAVQSISGTSFIDVLGLPMFWNEEGIYYVQQSQGNVPYGHGGYLVEPLTIGTILTFYNNIPFDSRRYARGDYDPVSYVVSWVYRSTQEIDISNRYQFDSSLNLNVHNRAFYPYTFGSNGLCFVNGISYVNYPSGSLIPQFKYLTSVGSQFTFSEENDNVTWMDWNSSSALTTASVSSFSNAPLVWADFINNNYWYNGHSYNSFTAWNSSLNGFSRSTPGTYVNSIGLLTTVGANVARFDYDPIALTPKGMLIEGAGTNTVLFSNTFTNAVWTTSGTLSQNVTGPDGVANSAWTITSSAGAGAAGQTGTPLTNASSGTVSAWAKAGTDNYVYFVLYDSNGNGANATSFNVSTGTVGTQNWGVGGNHATTVQLSGATMVAYPNGWYRCTSNWTIAGGLVLNRFNIAGADADNSGTFTTGKTVVIFGAQSETGLAATSYISTGAATVTRSNDLFNPFIPSISNSAVTLEVGYYAPAHSLGVGLAAVNNFSVANRVDLRGGTAPFGNSVESITSSGGVLQADIVTGNHQTTTNLAAVSASLAAGVNLVLNGGTSVTHSVATMPAVLNSFNLGSIDGGGNQVSTDYTTFGLWSGLAATATQLQTLTTTPVLGGLNLPTWLPVIGTAPNTITLSSVPSNAVVGSTIVDSTNHAIFPGTTITAINSNTITLSNALISNVVLGDTIQVSAGIDSPSFFTIGYKITGQGFKKFMPIYVYMYANGSINSSYGLNAVWDFATTNLGRLSSTEIITIPKTVTYSSGLTQAPQGGYGFVYNRHKLRGHGQAFQMTVSSVVGSPFHLIGWSIPQQVNIGS